MPHPPKSNEPVSRDGEICPGCQYCSPEHLPAEPVSGSEACAVCKVPFKDGEIRVSCLCGKHMAPMHPGCDTHRDEEIAEMLDAGLVSSLPAQEEEPWYLKVPFYEKRDAPAGDMATFDIPAIISHASKLAREEECKRIREIVEMLCHEDCCGNHLACHAASLRKDILSSLTPDT